MNWQVMNRADIDLACFRKTFISKNLRQVLPVDKDISDEAIVDIPTMRFDANWPRRNNFSNHHLAAESCSSLIFGVSIPRSLRRPSLFSALAVAQQSESVIRKPFSFCVPLLACSMVTTIMAMIMVMVVVLRMIGTMTTLIAWAVPLHRQRSPPGRKYWTNCFALKRSNFLQCQVSSIAQEVT